MKIISQKLFILSFVVLVITILSGCDKHKEERTNLLKQKSDVEADITKFKSQQSQLSQTIDRLNSDLSSDTESLQQSTIRHTKLKDELAKYVLDHKLATLALIATGGGAAGVLNENLDEDTRTSLMVAGVIGVFYCISNYEECADVTSKILYYGSQIESEGKSINSIKSNLVKNKTTLEESKKNLINLTKTIDEKSIKRNDLQVRHDELVCKFCF
jgi:outer membrane murein-binding lipoprotein Lpp